VLDAGYPPIGTHELRAAVICRHGPYLFAWDAAGRRQRVHLDRIRSGVSNETLFHRFYPKAPSVNDLEVYKYAFVRELSTA
jgi:hypothetical protein